MTLQVEASPGNLVPDIFWGEHATAYHVKNRGLVIISSCGHAGIINSIRQLQKVMGIDKVRAVAGGWHLAPAPAEVVAKTVAAFKEINPDDLIPMHCTGWNTIMAIQRGMPAKLIMPSTGTRGNSVHKPQQCIELTSTMEYPSRRHCPGAGFTRDVRPYSLAGQDTLQ